MASYLKASIQRSYAESFLAELERNENQYFFFIGRGTPWVVENSPDLYVDSVSSEYVAMNDAVAYKKINPQNIIFALPRFEWLSGTVYDQYQDNAAQFDDNNPSIFYVVTDDNNIYKCLSNNEGVGSTVKPSGVLPTPFKTSDGYVWQYLATVREGDLPYELTDYVPVDYVRTGNDTETINQYNAQISAVPSSITRISVTNGSSAGVYENTITGTGLVVRVSSYNPLTNQITVSDATSLDKIRNPNLTLGNYVGYIARVNYSTVNTSEVGNYAIITAVEETSTPTTVVFTLQNDVVDFTVTPTIAGTGVASIEILPYIKVTGTGTGAYVYPVMNTDNNIVGVEIVDSGKDYSKAIVETQSFKDPTTEHATFTATISPKGGHASNILKELNVKDVLIIVEVNEEDYEKFIEGGSYRQFGIIKNPVLSDGSGQIAGSDDRYYRDYTLAAENKNPEASHFSGSDQNIIVGTESFSSAKVIAVKSINQDDGKILVKTISSSAKFITNEDRLDNYILTLQTVPSVSFQPKEIVSQYIPKGTDFGGGVSYGFDFTVRGRVLSHSGRVVNVRLVSDGNFIVQSGITLVGSISGATGYISGVDPTYGEYVLVVKNTGASAEFVSVDGINDNQKAYRVVDAGESYLELERTPSYSGLHVLEMSTSINFLTGGIDTTSSFLSQNSFFEGDTIVQGITGSYEKYATGKVYDWQFVNQSYGKLYVTDVVGTFKSVETHGLSGSQLSEYVVASVVEPEIDRTSGEVLYIDNVRPIQRTTDQREEFRMRLGF